MGRGGYEKEAAVPLGVSLCPETGIIDAVTESPTGPSGQVGTPDRWSLDVWLAGPPGGSPVVENFPTILAELMAGAA